MNNFELKEKYGAVNFNGKEYILTQDAYADNYGNDSEVRYYAKAVDSDENEYCVAWETSERWNLSQELFCLEQKDEPTEEDLQRIEELSSMALTNYDDESNACDWDNPFSVEKI